MKKRIVIALGGNALGTTLPEQASAVKTTAKAIVDLIEDGVSGLFTENNPEALAAHIVKLCADPELRRTLGAGAAEKAKLYEEESVHAQMKEIYLSV